MPISWWASLGVEGDVDLRKGSCVPQDTKKEHLKLGESERQRESRCTEKSNMSDHIVSEVWRKRLP